MRIPERYRQLLEARWIFRSGWNTEGYPEIWQNAFGYEYPPLGFLPIELFALGNGDKYGLYWPIGREEEEPSSAKRTMIVRQLKLMHRIWKG